MQITTAQIVNQREKKVEILDGPSGPGERREREMEQVARKTPWEGMEKLVQLSLWEVENLRKAAGAVFTHMEYTGRGLTYRASAQPFEYQLNASDMEGLRKGWERLVKAEAEMRLVIEREEKLARAFKKDGNKKEREML